MIDREFQELMRQDIDNKSQVIPDLTRESLELYVSHGIMPGGFLRALLCNDLFEAYARADAFNIANMYAIVKYVFNKMPRGSWGSADNVRDWVRKFKEVSND